MYKTLSNGIKMPVIGFGTDWIDDSEQCCIAVKNAIRAGYRLVDTAAIYNNEPYIGRAIAEILNQREVKREDLFICTKIRWSATRFDDVLRSFDASMEGLGLEYIDQILLHHPNCLRNGIDGDVVLWRALERLYQEKRVRIIGVSNFQVWNLAPVVEEAEIKPMVNQLELNPQHQQPEIVRYCRKHGIVLQAWNPLIRQGRHEVAIERIESMAKKYSKTWAQLLLRWSVQKGFVPLPKSVRNERIIENFNIFDFEISDDDMKAMDANEGRGFSGYSAVNEAMRLWQSREGKQKGGLPHVVIPPHKITKFHYNLYRLLSNITFGKLRKKYKAKRRALKQLLKEKT